MFSLGGHGEDESQQAAEAMVQLSGVGFYNQQGKLFILSNLLRVVTKWELLVSVPSSFWI